METLNEKDKKDMVIALDQLDFVLSIMSVTDPVFYQQIKNKLIEIVNYSSLIESNIKDVIINGKATVIYWVDGTKTVVKYQRADNGVFSPEAGVAIAVTKKVFGNKGNFNNVLKRLVKRGLRKGGENK